MRWSDIDRANALRVTKFEHGGPVPVLRVPDGATPPVATEGGGVMYTMSNPPSTSTSPSWIRRLFLHRGSA